MQTVLPDVLFLFLSNTAQQSHRASTTGCPLHRQAAHHQLVGLLNSAAGSLSRFGCCLQDSAHRRPVTRHLHKVDRQEAPLSQGHMDEACWAVQTQVGKLCTAAGKSERTGLHQRRHWQCLLDATDRMTSFCSWHYTTAKDAAAGMSAVHPLQQQSCRVCSCIKQLDLAQLMDAKSLTMCCPR